jgi:fructokinase
VTADRSTTPTVVVVGDALIDELHENGVVRRYVGGAALNVAVRLSSLGVRTKLVAMIGNDSDGSTIGRFLESHNVELIPTIGPHGTARSSSHRINGEPRYSFNAAALERRIRVGPRERAALADADLVALSCFPFDDLEQTGEVIDAVSRASERLVVDPNPRQALLHDRDAFVATLHSVAAQCRLVKVSEEDALLLENTTVNEFAARVIQDGAETVLATLGGEGAWVRSAAGMLAKEPIVSLPAPIVDTMGAGDATLASVLHSIVSKGFPADATEWHTVLSTAMLAAAETCRHEGALRHAAI